MSEYQGVLQVVATVFVKPGEEARFLKVAEKILAPTRAEDGNISYELHESLTNPSEFMFLEMWGSKSALDLHLKTEHMAAFFDNVMPLFSAPPDIKTFRRLRN